MLLMSKTENLIKRMRWKTLAFLGKIEQSKHNQNYVFRTRNCPTVMEELREFECNLHLMIKNVVFKKVNNSFQTQLLNYVKKIKESDKCLFLPINRETFIC